MTNPVFSAVARHPYITATGVAVVVFLMSRQKATPAAAPVVVKTGPSDTQISTSAALEGARIEANSQSVLAKIAQQINQSRLNNSFDLAKLSSNTEAKQLNNSNAENTRNDLLAALQMTLNAGGTFGAQMGAGVLEALGQFTGVTIKPVTLLKSDVTVTPVTQTPIPVAGPAANNLTDAGVWTVPPHFMGDDHDYTTTHTGLRMQYLAEKSAWELSGYFKLSGGAPIGEFVKTG